MLLANILLMLIVIQIELLPISTPNGALQYAVLLLVNMTVDCLDLALCSDSNNNIPLVVHGTPTHVTFYTTPVRTHSAAKLDPVLVIGILDPGPWFNIKVLSYQYRKSHCGDKTVVKSSCLHNGICYTGKMTSFYWISPLNMMLQCVLCKSPVNMKY